MNNVTKMVLVPEDQFLRLKNQKTNPTDVILNSNLPDTFKVALSNQIDQIKAEPFQVKNYLKEDKKAVTIPENLLEYTETFNSPDSPAEIEDVFSTPMKTPLKSQKLANLNLVIRSIDNLIDENGAILNAEGKPIKDSNIDEIINFLSNKFARKKPKGLPRLITVIKEKNLPIADIIANKSIKTSLINAEPTSKSPKRKATTWEMLSKSF